jgi:hypothetical protein
MSINKLIVPGKKTLNEFLKYNGSTLFYMKYVKKIDVLIGDDDAVDFIEDFENKYYDTTSNMEFHSLD